MKSVTYWVGAFLLAIGLIPEALLLVGVADIAIASISNQLGLSPTWFDVSSNFWVRMMELAATGDYRIIASLGFAFIGALLLMLSDNMRHTPRT
jgi:hypothetical protein